MGGDGEAKERVRVMIVEDSLTVRRFLERLVSLDPRLTVTASVESGERALELLPTVAPDVISLDIRLPGIDGFEVVRRVMEEQPTPVVVCSASVETEELMISMNALRAGALSVVEKPVGASYEAFEPLARKLCTQLAIMSQVRVVRRKPALLRARPRPIPPAPGARPSGAGAIRAVGVVASTGGPQSVCELLAGLVRFPAPILLVQHIPASFAMGYVRWLDRECPLDVVAAEDGMRPAAGRVHVAPPERHLVVSDGRLRLTPDPAVLHHRPAGSVLLRSLAADLGVAAAGVVLTGMGDDGADGLLEIRRAGGLTIAQDEATSVVYGMPRAAVERGAAERVLPISAIAPALCLAAVTREEVAW